MWTYRQGTGDLIAPDGNDAGTGWSGNGEGYNNPAFEKVHGKGPLPKGWYKIIKPSFTSVHSGPFTLRLDPYPDNEMFDRSGFEIHGARKVNPEISSNGCIVLPREIRLKIESSTDDLLQVIE